MGNDIDLYLNSVYCGFQCLDKIQELFEEYRNEAIEMAEIIDWDEIVLFAIFGYDNETEAFISADFMKIRMNYDRYVRLVDKLSDNCRFFFVRNNTEVISHEIF